jgi:hypothetical protein
MRIMQRMLQAQAGLAISDQRQILESAGLRFSKHQDAPHEFF